MQMFCYLGKKISSKKKEATYLYPVKKGFDVKSL